MTRYRVATPTNRGFEGASECTSIDVVTGHLVAAGFEGCSVWRYDARAKHWRLIFDTSLPDASRLPGADYWHNVSQVNHA